MTNNYLFSGAKFVFCQTNNYNQASNLVMIIYSAKNKTKQRTKEDYL